MLFRLHITAQSGHEGHNMVTVYRDYDNHNDLAEAAGDFIRNDVLMDNDCAPFMFKADKNGWKLFGYDNGISRADVTVSIDHHLDRADELHADWYDDSGCSNLIDGADLNNLTWNARPEFRNECADTITRRIREIGALCEA